MKPLTTLRAAAPAPAAGVPGRRPGPARGNSPRAAVANDPAADTPFGQMVADVAADLAGLSAASHDLPVAGSSPSGPGRGAAMDADEQAAEAAVIAALRDAERRGAPPGRR